MINEPTAAAMAYGLERRTQSEYKVLVYDFGGGTLDISVLSVEDGVYTVLATQGDSHLGGQDVDVMLVHFCLLEFKRVTGVNTKATKRAENRLRNACEKAKHELS